MATVLPVSNGLEKYVENIRRTGFPLEFEIAEALRKHEWSVITNKYYIDDVQATVREIDIVAYKATAKNGVMIYTSIIVSCKKSEENVWALLSKKANTNDRNIDWSPLHTWAGAPDLRYMLSLPLWKTKYRDYMISNGLHTVVQEPARHIFAFQEMAKESGKPKNDKAIFESVTSLIKAQAYELNVLPLRKGKSPPSVYQFNLLNVVDTDLICLDFNDEEVVPSIIEQETYIASYIVEKKQTFARILFVKPSSLEVALEKYDKLHALNVSFFEKLSREFYADAVKVRQKREIFLEDFLKNVSSKLDWTFLEVVNRFSTIKDFDLMWSASSQAVKLLIKSGKNVVEKINEDESLINELKILLKKYYRYNGSLIVSEHF
jgi:hypothetical protein